MDELDKLKHFMKPYYQDGTPETDAFLTAYLTEYTYAECAAAALWGEKAGELAFENEGLLKTSTGAEKFEFGAPGTMQLAAKNQSEYYQSRCDDLNSVGACAIRVKKNSVGGIEEINGTSE